MTLPKSLTTVTTFSKLIALILFVLLPFIGFYLGLEYQSRVENVISSQNINPTFTPTPTLKPGEPNKTIRKLINFNLPTGWTEFYFPHGGTSLPNDTSITGISPDHEVIDDSGFPGLGVDYTISFDSSNPNGTIDDDINNYKKTSIAMRNLQKIKIDGFDGYYYEDKNPNTYSPARRYIVRKEKDLWSFYFLFGSSSTEKQIRNSLPDINNFINSVKFN